MGLRSVLVDRGRRVYKARAARKVDGSTLTAPVRGPWFACRLEPNSEAEAADPNGKRTVRAAASLMLVPTDAGTDIEASDQIELDSAEYGHHVWQVQSALDVVRKKRGAVLGLVELADPRDPEPDVGGP